MKNLFADKQFYTSDRNRTVRITFLNRVLNFAFVSSFMGLLAALFEQKNGMTIVVLFYTTLFLSLSIFKYLLKINKLEIAGWGLSIFIWVLIAFVVLFFGGLNGQNASVFCIVIMFAGSLFGGRAAIMLAILTTLFCSLVVYLELNAALPPQIGPGYSPINSLSAISVTLLLTAVLLYSMLNSISESEARYRILFDSSKDAMTTGDPDRLLGFTSCNKSALEMFGFANEKEFLKHGPVDLSPEFQSDGQLSTVKAQNMVELAMKKGSHAFEWTHKRKNGEEFLCHILLSVVHIDEQNILLATTRDITEQKRASEALKESEEKFRGLSEASFEAILIHQNGLILNYNKEFERIMELESRDELMGRLIFDSSNISDDIKKKIAEKMALGLNDPYTLNVAKKNGTKWVAEIQARPITYNGSPARVAAIRDITERQRSEETIKMNSDLLTSQNRQLVDFCNIVSHNLRAPLVNLSMLVNFLEESKDSTETKLLVGKLKPVITNLNETFEELVESIQIKNDTDILSEQNNIQELFNKNIEGLNTEILNCNATLKFDFSEAPIISFPSKYLNSILHNLISNALRYKAMNRAPEIIVKTEKTEHGILLSVKDNGLGIDLVKHKNNLFKIRKTFHENPNAKGFGLYMTKAQVDAMNGEIWVESEPDKGSTFFVEFKNQKI